MVFQRRFYCFVSNKTARSGYKISLQKPDCISYRLDPNKSSSRATIMEGLTMMRFFAGVFLIFLIATPIKAKPTTTPAPPSEEKDILLMVPTNEDNLEVVPIDDGPKNDDGEILETANSIVFRPLFSYRRTHSQRRRVYAPRRIGYHYGSYYDRFPTLA